MPPPSGREPAAWECRDAVDLEAAILMNANRRRVWLFRDGTHSRPRTATIDDYTTLVWNPLCDEVARLRITLCGRGGDATSAIANVANSRPLADDRATGSVQGPNSKTISRYLSCGVDGT
jgi:hypothetical protein